LESGALRRKLGLMDNKEGGAIDGGVRVTGIFAPSPRLQLRKRDFEELNDDSNIQYENSDYIIEEDESNEKDVLKPGDVILHIDGINVGEDGTVPLSPSRPYERINMSYLIKRHKVGTTLTLGIMRDHKLLTLNLTLTPSRYLCPVFESYDAHPSYAVIGGCVFVPVSHPWFSNFYTSTKSKTNSSTMASLFPTVSKLPADGDKQPIVLTKILADEVNVGYHNLQLLVLNTVNGEEPRNIRDLVYIISKILKNNDNKNKKCNDNDSKENPYIEFSFEKSNISYCEIIICLETDECLKTEDRIMKQHMIASWCSEDAIPDGIKFEDARTMSSLCKLNQ